jgi:hypothetical protein
MASTRSKGKRVQREESIEVPESLKRQRTAGTGEDDSQSEVSTEVSASQAQIIESHSTSLTTININNRSLTVDDLNRYLDTLDIGSQYSVLEEAALNFEKGMERADHLALTLESIALQRGFEDDMKHNAEAWAMVKRGAESAMKTRNEKREAIKKVESLWGEGAVKRTFGDVYTLQASTWKYLRALSNVCHKKGYSLDTLRKAVLKAQVLRIANPKPGTSNKNTVEGADLKCAKKLIEGLKNCTVTTRELTAIGRGRNLAGLICAASEDAGVGDEEVEDEDKEEGRQLRPREQKQLAYREESDEDDLDDVDERGEEQDLVRAGGQGFDDGYTPDDEGVISEIEEIDDEITEVEGGEEEVVGDARVRRSTKKRKGDSHTCGCGIEIPRGFIRQFKKGYSPDEISRARIINNWKRHGGGNTLSIFCYGHSKLIAASLGLKSKGLKKEELVERMERYHTAVKDSNLGALKIGDETYAWFRRLNRPVRPSDALGPYKYFPIAAVAFEFTEEHQMNLAAFVGIDMGEWDKIGSINLPIFKWWNEMKYEGDMVEIKELEGYTVRDVALEEFDMYDHHLREIDGTPNFGWLRTMFHGVVQQAMRQDPMYYAAYCTLRSDRNTNLLSYPYYAKYQKKGDSTYFRHIDINIPGLEEDKRGWFQIQGTVSLDDEQDDDCTEILPGMHKKISPWHAKLKDRAAEGAVSLSGLVSNITKEMFNEDDKKEFDTNWTAVPCSAGEVRITQPHLPHGAKGPAKRKRRTMLPWFVALQEDLYHLEVTEGGTFEDLAKAHRDLTSGPRTPSGLANRYGDIPFAFSAAVPLTGLGQISDALVGRVKYDRATVVAEKAQFLKGTDEERRRYVKEWRQNALRAIMKAWSEVKKHEKICFGDKSYFKRIEEGAAVVDADIAPDSGEYISGGHGHEDEEAQGLARGGGEEAESESEEDEMKG